MMNVNGLTNLNSPELQYSCMSIMHPLLIKSMLSVQPEAMIKTCHEKKGKVSMVISPSIHN